MAAPFIAGYFVSYVFRMVNAVLAPVLAREFDLTAGGLGLLSGVYFLSFALFQLPAGLLLDRFGPRRVNAALLLVAAAGGLWFAGAESAGAAAAARALIGLGVAVCLMSTFQAFVLWYPAGQISTMNAIAFSAGALGGITVTVPLELLLRVLHWREAFLIIVGFTLAVSALLWFWAPERSTGTRGEPLANQLRGLGRLMRDAAFLRAAICLGLSQFTAVSLQTLWVATWLRDVVGWNPAEVALGLLAVNGSMIVGYLVFGRAADAAARRGHSARPVLLGGLLLSSLSLGLLALGVTRASLLLWCLFVLGGTAITLVYSMLSRRTPKEMSGRVNTALNVFAFAGVFVGQWVFGLVLDLWPQTATGYAPDAYGVALGLCWVIQAAGIAWLWSGRRLL